MNRFFHSQNINAVAPPVLDEVVIGTQTWSAFNLDIDDAGTGISSVNGSSVNDPIYGLLYTYEAASRVVGNISGWRLPTEADIITLIATVGALEGRKLKEAGLTYWNSPNTGATNSSGFGGRGAGYVAPDNNYYQLKTNLNFWTSTTGSINNKKTAQLSNVADNMFLSDFPLAPNVAKASIRLIKE